MHRKKTNTGVAGGKGADGTYKLANGEFAENVSKPQHKSTRSFELHKKVAQSAKKEEPIELSEPLTSLRPLRQKSTGKSTSAGSTTMTIENIQIALGTAIERCRVNRIVNMIGNNFELVNNAVNSKDTVTMELLKKAIDLISRDDGSTIFHLIAHKEDKAKILELFLKLDGVKVIKSIDIVKNGKSKTAHQIARDKNNKEFLEVIDNAQEKKKISSVNLDDTKAHSNLLIQRSSSESSLVEPSRVIQNSKSNIELSEMKATDSENLLFKLNRLVKKQDIYGVLNLLIYNIELAYSALESKDKVVQLITNNLLAKAADIQLKATENNIFSLLFQRQPVTGSTIKTIKLFLKVESKKFLEIITDYKLRKAYEEFDITYYLMQLQNAMKVENNEEKIPLDVATESGNKKSTNTMKELRNGLGNFHSIIAELQANDTQTPPQSPVRLSLLSENSHDPDSDTDSGIYSPGQSTKAQNSLKESVESLTNSRRRSFSSSRESVNSILSKVDNRESEEFPIATETLPPLNKERHKGQNRRKPSKRLDQLCGKAEDHIQEENPTPVVTPVSSTEMTSTLKTQSNNRNFYIIGCASLAVGCVVAAIITQSVALLIIGALFAIAATTFHFTPLSEMESTNITEQTFSKNTTRS